MPERATYGWAGSFAELEAAQPLDVRRRLQRVYADVSEAQVRAWDDSIPLLQRELGAVVAAQAAAAGDTAVFEYELPLEQRRPDVVLLVGDPIVVLELKGKAHPDQVDLDQAAAYARDLRSYHQHCHDREVVAVLVPTRARGYVGEFGGTHVVGPDRLHALLASLRARGGASSLPPEDFLGADAYQPLPSLVRAARWVFEHGDLPRVHRAHSYTQPTVDALTAICHEAARTRTRHLVLVTGVPGAGKTLVGLRLVHARFLAELAVERRGRRLSPAVFLSGNGPLVTVLQHELRRASATLAAKDPARPAVSGKEFVRGVKDYVRAHGTTRRTPTEHVLVFDEAQRAWDAEHVRRKHRDPTMRSEPAHFVEFAERIPEWCVVVGLVGTGQEIHVGEESGLDLWRRAVADSPSRDAWTVHAPMHLAEAFGGLTVRGIPALNLDKEIRFHRARHVHEVAAGLLARRPAAEVCALVEALERDGYHLRLTRDLEVARGYLKRRYADARHDRFGMLVSSRDRSLGLFGVPKLQRQGRYHRFPVGEWFTNDESEPVSCRHLGLAATEFECQGLELDAALLAWGGDLLVDPDTGAWSDAGARRFQDRKAVRDPLTLRKNAYRVLLTRARDGLVVFVPPQQAFDATFAYLQASGFLALG
jgi:hypothetical protein